MGKDRSGAKGADLVLQVPVGTQILDDDKETVLADLIAVPASASCCCAAATAASATRITRPRPTRRRAAPIPGWPGAGALGLAAPEADRRCRAGRAAQRRQVDLPRRVCRAPSRRSPTIPFTTLQPQLGVVRRRRRASSCSPTCPGLIEGAHEGAGLGTRFLGHVERCARAAAPGRRHRRTTWSAPTARSAASSPPTATASPRSRRSSASTRSTRSTRTSVEKKRPRNWPAPPCRAAGAAAIRRQRLLGLRRCIGSKVEEPEVARGRRHRVRCTASARRSRARNCDSADHLTRTTRAATR